MLVLAAWIEAAEGGATILSTAAGKRPAKA